jgi:hypothetical protein
VTGRILYVGIPGNDAGALGQEKGAANPAKLFICSARERGEGGSRCCGGADNKKTAIIVKGWIRLYCILNLNLKGLRHEMDIFLKAYNNK